MKGLILSALSGTALGIVATRMLFLSWFTLVPWGLAGLVVGYLTGRTKTAAINGAVYGFFLAFFFMLFVYVGNELISKVPFYILLGLFGALCGALLAFAGAYLKPRLARPKQ